MNALHEVLKYTVHAGGTDGCGHYHRTVKAAEKCLPRMSGPDKPTIYVVEFAMDGSLLGEWALAEHESILAAREAK
jgi:hypothetical protein